MLCRLLEPSQEGLILSLQEAWLPLSIEGNIHPTEDIYSKN